jgi:hypothetical protein
LRLGEWTPIVREVAAFDHARALAIAHWPLRELLIGYVARLREQAAEVLRHNQLLFQIRVMWGGTEQPPEVPPILRETDQQ